MVNNICDLFQYRLRGILKSVTSTMKKYIQVAKQKSRRYLIQEDYLQSLFEKV